MSDEMEEDVEVLYDYEYSDDGGPVQIKTGDIYKLIEKTNSEWWQVDDPSDVNGQPFYVPAHYVKIVSEKSIHKTDFDSGFADSSDTCKDQVFEKHDINKNVDYANATFPGLRIEGERDYVNLAEYRDAAGIPGLASDSISGPSAADPPAKITKPQTIPQELIQGTVAPPLPEEGTFVKVLLKDQPWDIYKENTLGRMFFVNRETGERAWKPPRKTVSSQDKSKATQPSATTTTTPSVPVKEESTEISSEYDEVHDNGTRYFINKTTQEKNRDVNLEVPCQRPSNPGVQSMRMSKAKSTFGQLETTLSSRASTLPAKFLGVRPEFSVNERSNSPQRPTVLTTANSSGSQASEDTYGGYLYKSMIVDISKKKFKKSWTQVYVVLQGSNLIFYKDQKSASQKQGSPYGKPEAVVSILGAHVELNPKEVTNKRNTMLLRVRAGNVYAFQSDSEKENLEWFTRMKLVANDFSPTESSPRDQNGQEVKKDERQSERGMVRSASADDNTVVHNVDKIRNIVGIRARLLSLISRRPTQEDLYKRGIIKDAVFGSRLHELCDREKDNVPHFVRSCIAAIEKRGLTHDGLYRVSGNMAEIQRLRCTVDTDDKYDLYDSQWDIHVLTGTLKLFFRELKEPIFPFSMYDRFFDAIKKEQRSEKLSAFSSAVSKLPRCNYATLKELFQHLRRVVEASHKNRMQTQNIAIVFGPTLLWQLCASESLAVETVFQSKIVEFILTEYNELFK